MSPDVIMFLEEANARGTIKISRDYLDKLKQQAYSDQLTGLGNRSKDTRAIQSMLRRADRVNKPIALISFDITNFKALNDVYGHAAGDKALTIVGKVMKEATRGHGNDVAGIATRTGGDEFNVLLYNVNKHNADRVVERLEHAIDEQLTQAGLDHIDTKHGTRYIRAIGGVAIRDPDSTTDVSSFRKEADLNAYNKAQRIKKELNEPSGRFNISDVENFSKAA